MSRVTDLSVELIEELRPLVERIRRRDKSLADQLQRAASSISLNLAEGHLSQGGNRRARYFTAVGSASESRAALRVAVAWRHIKPEQAASARALLERVIGILFALTRR